MTDAAPDFLTIMLPRLLDQSITAGLLFFAVWLLSKTLKKQYEERFKQYENRITALEGHVIVCEEHRMQLAAEMRAYQNDRVAKLEALVERKIDKPEQ